MDLVGDDVDERARESCSCLARGFDFGVVDVKEADEINFDFDSVCRHRYRAAS